ncbi:hypothetical protein GCM10028803_30540 [Larkinella knui]|uniref:Uncharacterized protein n=1 Tax=Larkinella knui TaxID=2025310 RepID=A0A3P1CXE1_9BACT|nr:hypothetical protein EHT87_07355 [Larkinella knui]
MNISREEYDRQPLLIREGAIKLWGVPLARSVDLCRTRQLFSFNDFFVEICHDNSDQKLTCICSFSRVQRLDLYLEQMDLSPLVT